MIEGIRKAVGPDVQVLIDAHAMYNVPTAVRLATRLAPYDITWFEEPVPPESYEALATVRNQVPVRICVGERLYTRFEFLPILNRHLTDYIMPDVTWTGGISELKKIATLAETFYTPISPHDASGPVNLMAGAQVAIIGAELLPAGGAADQAGLLQRVPGGAADGPGRRADRPEQARPGRQDRRRVPEGATRSTDREPHPGPSPLRGEGAGAPLPSR